MLKRLKKGLLIKKDAKGKYLTKIVGKIRENNVCAVQKIYDNQINNQIIYCKKQQCQYLIEDKDFFEPGDLVFWCCKKGYNKNEFDNYYKRLDLNKKVECLT